MEDEERLRKLEAGKAKLAQFRQRKAQTDGQNGSKKQKKKKKAASIKDDESIQDGIDINRSLGDETSISSSRRGATSAAAAAAADFAVTRTLHSGEITKHSQTCGIEPESEISTTVEDYSSEVNGCSFLTRTAILADLIREEEFGVGEICYEHGMQHSHTQLEVMENELAGKQQEIEELNRELEEMRATYGTEGLQQLQEFEAAIKKRDDIITQLTTNLQQARKEKDETMREFLELTEQSQKLQIQFQHLQASEALRNTSHSCTAADLLQAKQQILSHQQQLEEQECLLKNYQKKNEEFEAQITCLQDRIATYELEKQKNEGEDLSQLQEKEALIEELEAKLGEEEKSSFQLKEKLSDVSKLLDELKEQVSLKNQEINNVRVELATYKQKEKQCSDEIKQLMGTVEELQKRCYKDSQCEADTVQRMELETQRRLAQLQAELDEMHGQQIVQMKQELIKQHSVEIEQRLSQQKVELEKTLSLCLNENVNENQMHLMNIKINELNVKLQDADNEREKIKQEFSQQMEAISAERSLQQTKIEDLFQELNFSREQVQRAKQTIADMECKLNEAEKYQSVIEDLKTQLASASEFRKDLELKHETEVTNYKIKLEMLEREKDAVLDRMAESQEAELERLRTKLLFSHEEELSRLKEDLEKEHMVNIESLKDNLNTHHKEQLNVVQNEMSQKVEAMQYEKDKLIAKQDELILEISNLKDLQESIVNSKTEEMTLQIHELQKEIEVLRQEEKEKGTLEQEIQELKLKTELMQDQMRVREDSLQKKCSELETQNNLLKGENKTLEEKLTSVLVSTEESVMFNDSASSKSEILDLQKRIEKLITENKQLKNQNSQLQEDTEQQKSAFSFTEKKLEANYKELQKECVSLLKAKTELEENKNKQKVEYEGKLKALNEKLHHLQSNRLILFKTKASGFEGGKEIKVSGADTFEAAEVVEKYATELTEKLEVTQREKLELSLRVSDLSEQLKSKHSEICHLNEKVKLLKDEKEQVLAKCKELEVIISHAQRGNSSSSNKPKTKCSKARAPKTAAPASESRNKTTTPRNKVDEGINVRENLGSGKDISHEVPKRKEVQHMLKAEQSLLEHLHVMSDRLTDDPSLIAVAQSENNLQQQVDALKSEQTDLQLQMEAQRICLSLVYSAHVDQVREYLKAEKESALCSLKEELVRSHLQEINDLKKMHQLELQTLKIQQADDEVKSAQRLIEKLNEAVTEECSRLVQILCDNQNEYSSAAVEIGDGEQDVFHSPAAVKEKLDVELPIHRGQAKVPGYLCNLAVQKHMDALLHKIMEEYSRLKVLQGQLMKDCKQVKEPWLSSSERRKEEEPNCQEIRKEYLQTSSQSVMDPTIQEYCSKEIGSLKTQLEEQHARELEHLRSYFQQQLKESEERYTTEIVHLQDKLQSVGVSADHSSVSTNSQIKLKEVRKVKDTGNQRTDETLELASEIEMRNDLDVVQLLEKQYQERLEEEIAKVIVSMSVAFAKQTELSRIARQKEEEAQIQIERQCNEEEVDVPLRKPSAEGSKHEEESKSLCKELSEESGEINSLGEQLHANGKSGCLQTTHESEISEELFSHVKGLTAEETLHYSEMMASDTQTSNQLLLYEERLEDMRQELVRQYQEHQQATELLRQGHMQQMERQKENQEQLLAELESLKVQLAERVSMENDSLAAERERMLLEELESLKQHSVPGKEKLLCKLQNSSTQTESENDSQNNVREQIFEDENGGRKPETSSALLSKERHVLQKANEKLIKILLEVVKTTVAVEETIGHHVLGLLDRTGKVQPSKPAGWDTEAEESVKPCVHVGFEKESCPSYHGSNVGDDDINLWSGATDEGLLNQHLAESGVEIDPENEELFLNISSRLQAAVEKLLEAINETSNQLEHARITQTELVRESFKKQQEATEFIKYQEELQERLNEETKAREQLALELSKAEGLIDGYADEKVFLEKQLQEKIDVIDHLEQELLCTGNKLQELEAEQQQIQEEKELLSRQKDAMRADAGPVEQRLVDAAVDAASQAELLEETEKLMKEKIEVQRQAEKEYDDLQKQVKVLEIDLEEQVNRLIELEQEKNSELMDLRQQNQALEKQLEKTRKFLDEQAIDREHERDVFQQEIQKLEQQLKVPQRTQPVNEHQTREVEQLTNHLKEKTDKCSELLLSKEQLQRDIQERNEEIEKLECRIRELEQALIISADNLQKVEERKQFGTIIVKGELPLEVQLQAEREAVDRKEKEVTNLEEQLEQFREELENKNEEVQQLHMQLEIQRKESTTHLRELEQENKLFKDEMEILGLAIQKSEDVAIKDHHLVAERLAHFLQEKEQEIDHLHEQIAKLQQQLEVTTDNKVIEEQNEHIRELETQIECLKSDQERVKKKNYEEVEQLNDVIDKLQQELANIEQKVPTDIAAFQEDADSLKYTLETVLAEREALEKQVENMSVEASQAKIELEETNLKMDLLQQEINMLKKEHERITETYKCALMKGDKTKDGSSGKSEKMEGGSCEIKLLDQTQLRSSDENTSVTISKMEVQLQQLQACIKEKDSELCQSYNEIKDLKEQGKAERETLEKKILELEKTLVEKVAAALVSQVELNAVQEQRKFVQETREASKCVEEASRNAKTESSSDRTKNEMKSKLSILAQRLSEMENQLAMVNRNLELEKENVIIAQKEAEVKEERLLELQQLLEVVQEKHKREIQEYIKQEEMQTYQVGAQLMESQKENVLIDEVELKKVKEEAAAAKEELSSYREKAEKLQQELAVKEASLINLQEDLCKVKENLIKAEERLASYMQKGKEMAKVVSKKDAEILCDLSATESTVIIRSSSSQTDRTVEINSCNQTSPVLVKNAEIQIDLQNGCSSEEIAEIIREFNEKIEQMQELHAAEIMDMETRHISESEALKREKFVAVQVLTEECNTLKEIIETLRAKEGITVSGLVRSPPYQARDGGSSDSSSDWSQGVYLAQTQGSDVIAEGIDEGETSTDLLPKKIKGLLRAVHHEGIQVLSLTEFPYGEREMPPLKQESESWLEERKAFLSTISSLKDLIAKMQLHREAEIYASTESEGISDWRGELLHAIQQLFVREQNVLLAAFQTELAELGTRDAVILMNQLEHRLQEQASDQRAAMDSLQNADRRSLLMEIQVLHAQMNSKKNNPKREQEMDSKSQEMLEYNMQQKQSQILEMQVELRTMKDRAAELQEQLNSERMMGAELKNELAQAKLELETTLKAQHKHFRDLETIRTEVKEKAAELDILKDTMASEQKKSRELQWALEKEKAKMERSEERGREELEDLKFSLEDQKQKNLLLTKLLEQEKQLSTDLQQKIESQEALSAAQLSRERGRNSELQVLLESEKVRALEISSALEREKELCAQLQSAEDKEQAGTPNPSEELLKELQKQMDEKHDRIVELVREMEKYKLESVQVRQQMEKERQIQRKALQAEQDANIIAQKKLHDLESKVDDLQWQLGEKKQEVHKLGNETKKLQEMIQELQKKEQENEGRKEAERTSSHNPNETAWDTPNERTRNWVLQQKMEGVETNESTYPTLTGGGDLSSATEILENVRQKLQSASPKLQQLARKAASRLQFETVDDQDFIAIQNAIEEVISELQKLPGLSYLEELKLVLPAGTPSSSLTERLLRQNAELTGFVSRLSEEKNNLRNAVMKLEEELRRYQHKQPSGDYSSRQSSDVGVNIDTLVASEKEIWNREKLSLQKSLKQADAELSKLRAELRSEAFLRELGSDSENAVLRRIYGKYLRAESFRKALIYQKKYLLLLLGGFQECEEATLALIARMGGQPSYTDLEIITHHSKGFTRFRSAVRVSIAISRMKFLVRRWQRVTGSGILSVNRDVFSQNTGNELRPDSFSGGMDLYGEQRHSYRSRFPSMHADLNPASFTCSQLQNYDPERALTDYINRLEALQRRLGSVQSGSTSYTQLHLGIRR
ncbi:A-kinase anchor protein 9 isoform X2 [Cuculus canorus]|uniref:A-kinase anchor protein 9 isoform X2 n=1 Tax=Cuculus canorus TaxID=55661 RepID=UPI0023AB228A|nr:A-kinase anchor protein 9 isoform X2 [Cuculus canorus]